MSAFTLKSARFPAGTSVGAYPRSAWGGPSTSPPEGAPSGAASETATVGSDNSLTFTTLVDGVRYYAYANVGGENRIVGFTPGVPSVSGGGGGSGYATVRDEGVAVTQRSALNFVGASITAADNAGASATDVTVRVQAERKRVLWAPTGLIDDTTIGGGRSAGFSNITPLTSGTLRLVGGAVIPAGVTVTTITFFSGSTAAGTPTNQWFCLVRQSDLSVLAKTQDATTAAWGSNLGKTLSLAAGAGGSGVYTAPAETAVYVGILVAATTVPSMTGYTLQNGDVSTAAPQFSGNSTTALTNPASLGATAAALSSSAAIATPYAQLA